MGSPVPPSATSTVVSRMRTNLQQAAGEHEGVAGGHHGDEALLDLAEVAAPAAAAGVADLQERRLDDGADVHAGLWAVRAPRMWTRPSLSRNSLR